MRVVVVIALISAACQAEEALGVWRAKDLVVRFEAHAKGEVFTLDTTDPSGRTTTSSTILYFDGRAREFQDARCSGTQSSRRLDSSTVEILRQCAGSTWTRFVRRGLVLEITEQRADGRRLERRLVMEKQ